ncbi:hypothetical protein ABK040_015395 [Willaertia magna]
MPKKKPTTSTSKSASETSKKKKEEKQKEEVKLVVFGSGGVGKSALIVQLIQNVFVEHYDPTLEDSYRRDAILENKKEIIMDILDTAGQEEFVTLRDQYIRQGEGFVIVYSITNRNSFEEIESFIEHILHTKGIDEENYSNANKEVAIVIVANKCDLENDRVVSKEEGKDLCAKYGGISFYEASAKSRLFVDEIFMDCAQQVFLKLKKEKDGKCLVM